MIGYGYQPSVPWVPTRDDVIRSLVSILRPKRGDIIYDIGCGDGRVAVALAEAFPYVRVRCVELRSDLAERARQAVRKRGLADRVEVIEADFFKIPLEDADIVYMYLLTSVNQKLRPKLESELRPGAIVVSLDFPVPGWNPITTYELQRSWQRTFYIYVRGISDQSLEPLDKGKLLHQALERLRKGNTCEDTI
ncbi:MAG TPA: methyltransferase domain-containing protein [Pyrodictium delaneyi]|uniref:Methyltransferase domain-containing protein n=1 Tax=Pyrodictium delaneyi TaxID=1273541 RepID=A0A832ZUI0_9CREN|nr:methyltransferase domain-containing protein [Pyrodictium delaneyi]